MKASCTRYRMVDIKLNLDRLRHRHPLNISGYDETTHLDMTYALRTWVEMKPDIQR